MLFVLLAAVEACPTTKPGEKTNLSGAHSYLKPLNVVPQKNDTCLYAAELQKEPSEVFSL